MAKETVSVSNVGEEPDQKGSNNSIINDLFFFLLSNRYLKSFICYEFLKKKNPKIIS